MNIRNLFKIKYLFLACFLVSCTKQVEIDIENLKETPVINCLNKEGDSFKIFLSSTSSIFSDQNSFDHKAEGFLLINDTLEEHLEYDSLTSSFTSATLSKSGNQYRIILKYDNAYELHAYDNMPSPANIQNMNFVDSILYDEEGNSISELRILINDKPGIRNYYEVKLAAIYYFINDYEPIYNIVNISHAYNNHSVFQNEGLMQYYPESFLFSDELFDGKEISIPFRYFKIQYLSNSGEIKTTYKLIVKIRSVSANYFQYKKQLIFHEWNQSSDIWDGVGEPIEMYTNIQGGYGIFATYSEKVDTLVKH